MVTFKLQISFSCSVIRNFHAIQRSGIEWWHGHFRRLGLLKSWGCLLDSHIMSKASDQFDGSDCVCSFGMKLTWDINDPKLPQVSFATAYDCGCYCITRTVINRTHSSVTWWRRITTLKIACSATHCLTTFILRLSYLSSHFPMLLHASSFRFALG